MRPMLLFLAVCLAWPALAASVGLAECAAVESALERLDCFDKLARERLAGDGPRAANAATVEPASPSGTSSSVEETPPPTSTAAGPATGEPGNPGLFGQRPRPEPVDSTDYIEARIDEVRRAPLGEHIMTLSNGQVWMENEPGRRSIAAGQDVIIRKHRWHFEMELAPQPDVAVRRVR